MAMMDESKLDHKIKMGKAVQSPSVSIKTVYAQLKGLATACEYKNTSQCARNNMIDYTDHVIQDQLKRGITNHKILTDLLGDENTDRNTGEIVEYITRMEQAKAKRGTVCSKAPVNAAISPKRGAILYRGCDGLDHGGGIRDSVIV